MSSDNLKLPKNVCEKISNMTPPTQVEQIAEYVHWIITEDEFKTNEDYSDDVLPILFTYHTEVSESPDTQQPIHLVVAIDTQVLLIEGQQRNILELWSSDNSLFRNDPIRLPARELRQINLPERCLRIAQLIHEHMFRRDGEYEIMENGRKRAIPQIIAQRTQALMSLNHEEILLPSIAKEMRKWFSQDDFACLNVLMPIVSNFVANADQIKTEKSRIVRADDLKNSQIPRRGDLTFSKLMKITGRSVKHRNDSFKTILEKFAEKKWNDEIVCFRKGKRGGKASEIIFTLQGFLLAFTCLNDKMSNMVIALQAKITGWVMTTFAYKMNEQKAILEQQLKEIQLNAAVLGQNVRLQFEKAELEDTCGEIGYERAELRKAVECTEESPFKILCLLLTGEARESGDIKRQYNKRQLKLIWHVWKQMKSDGFVHRKTKKSGFSFTSIHKKNIFQRAVLMLKAIWVATNPDIKKHLKK